MRIKIQAHHYVIISYFVHFLVTCTCRPISFNVSVCWVESFFHSFSITALFLCLSLSLPFLCHIILFNPLFFSRCLSSFFLSNSKETYPHEWNNREHLWKFWNVLKSTVGILVFSYFRFCVCKTFRQAYHTRFCNNGIRNVVNGL